MLWIDLDSINSHNVSSAQETVITHLLSYCFLQFWNKAINKEININPGRWASNMLVMNMISIMIISTFIKRKRCFQRVIPKPCYQAAYFQTISQMCSICPLSVAAHTHGGWDCRGLDPEQFWTDEPSWAAKGTFLKKTFFPLRKDEETISEVGMVDWISKCEFIAEKRIAQWFITLALESKGGRVAQWFITMALESKG